MAANAAHVTATSFIKPSIFEIIAQETLARTLHPGLKQFALYLSSRHPDLLGWVYEKFDENFLVFELLLQLHYLKKYNATFSESFYNLERVSAYQSNDRNLSWKQILASLFFEVFLQYARRKMDTYYVHSQLESSSNSSEAGTKITVELLRSIQLCAESISLLSYLTYISGLSQNHSVLLRLANVTLISKPEEAASNFDWTNCWRAFRSRELSPLKFCQKTVAEVFSHSIEVGAFFVQFLQWWFSEHPHKTLSSNPVPPYPALSEEAQTFAGKCPICLGPRKTDTVLPVSGYVFCYLCIARVLKESGRCPISNLPASASDLVRLYP
nr:PREDICTED: peroxisome assembly protein 12 [Bemisia tabaci]